MVHACIHTVHTIHTCINVHVYVCTWIWLHTVHIGQRYLHVQCTSTLVHTCAVHSTGICVHVERALRNYRLPNLPVLVHAHVVNCLVKTKMKSNFRMREILNLTYFTKEKGKRWSKKDVCCTHTLSFMCCINLTNMLYKYCIIKAKMTLFTLNASTPPKGSKIYKTVTTQHPFVIWHKSFPSPHLTNCPAVHPLKWGSFPIAMEAGKWRLPTDLPGRCERSHR